MTSGQIQADTPGSTLFPESVECKEETEWPYRALNHLTVSVMAASPHSTAAHSMGTGKGEVLLFVLIRLVTLLILVFTQPHSQALVHGHEILGTRLVFTMVCTNHYCNIRPKHCLFGAQECIELGKRSCKCKGGTSLVSRPGYEAKEEPERKHSSQYFTSSYKHIKDPLFFY